MVVATYACMRSILGIRGYVCARVCVWVEGWGCNAQDEAHLPENGLLSLTDNSFALLPSSVSVACREFHIYEASMHL